MTVKDLREVLASLPDDVPVMLEGHCCWGVLEGYTRGRYQDGREIVLLTITDEYFPENWANPYDKARGFVS